MSWLVFAVSLAVAPALGMLRVPQEIYWFLNPGIPIRHHLGFYFALASIPTVLGVVVAVFGLALRRAWIRFGASCLFNALWLAVAVAATGD